MRPILTSWFAEFAALRQPPSGGVAYGPGGAAFAGATYDPTSHYRGAAVFEFHARQRLTADRLHAINRRQVAALQSNVERLDLDPAVAHVEPMPDGRRGGFLAIRAPRAADFSRLLHARGVFTDSRGSILRLGPAPYLADQQLRDAATALGDVVREA
jgi:kynureninase